MKDLWILTEERPKKNVLKSIINKFTEDYSFDADYTQMGIKPIINDGLFQFEFIVEGIQIESVNKIRIKIISGPSSFVDFLIYYQSTQPTPEQSPIYAIEETKTSGKESRNTGVSQRGSKFVYIDSFYPAAEKIMLYNIQIKSHRDPTSYPDTIIFGTRMLLTLGVEVMGKNLNTDVFKPYGSYDELIDHKNSMASPPAGNVPIEIIKHNNKITVSGRLFKSTGLHHDPNIGGLSLICACLRKLGWHNEIVITRHGLEQKHLSPKNKFVKIAEKVDVNFEDLERPTASFHNAYWKYAKTQEKLGTIFLHLATEYFTEGKSIFENHGGCEKGYFHTPEGKFLALKKYVDTKKYKAGDKSQRIAIPDLIIYDQHRDEIINIEGKTHARRKNGVEEIGDFDAIEEIYIKEHYPSATIKRTVALYGSKQTKIDSPQIVFLLNENGEIIFNNNAPEIFNDLARKINAISE